MSRVRACTAYTTYGSTRHACTVFSVLRFPSFFLPLKTRLSTLHVLPRAQTSGAAPPQPACRVRRPKGQKSPRVSVLSLLFHNGALWHILATNTGTPPIPKEIFRRPWSSRWIGTRVPPGTSGSASCHNRPPAASVDDGSCVERRSGRPAGVLAVDGELQDYSAPSAVTAGRGGRLAAPLRNKEFTNPRNTKYLLSE